MRFLRGSAIAKTIFPTLSEILSSFREFFSLTAGCVKDVAVRGMAGGAGSRQMIVSASRYGWRRFKDDLHFYVMLGALPLGSVIFYANYIIGMSVRGQRSGVIVWYSSLLYLMQ